MNGFGITEALYYILFTFF